MKKKTLLAVPLGGWAVVLGCSSPSVGTRLHDAGVDLPAPMKDAHPVDYYCPADAMGGGVCPINFCGTLETANALAANPSGYAQSGSDSLCNSGRICVVGAPVAASDAFQLTCVAPLSGALAYGATCSPTGVGGLRCANDALCVASPDFPTDPFCSTMCRNDADCPASSFCLEYPTPQAPDGSIAKVGLCTPSSKVAGTACTHESACPAGQGCVSYGARTSFNICKAPSASTATKTVGTACSGNSDCLSGACFDRTFRLAGGSNRTYCSSVCTVNSDCGPGQICTRLVQNNNGTPTDPTDDVVIGECQTLFIANGAAGCGSNADCLTLNNGSDTCDASYGLCYNGEAVPGSACTMDTDCMLGGFCATGARFPGGYCQSYGCAPDPTGSTPSVDLCLGAGSFCAQRGGPDFPLHACYDGCVVGSDAAAQMCLRAAVGYFCDSPVSGQPANICLGATGT